MENNQTLTFEAAKLLRELEKEARDRVLAYFVPEDNYVTEISAVVEACDLGSKLKTTVMFSINDKQVRFQILDLDAKLLRDNPIEFSREIRSRATAKIAEIIYNQMAGTIKHVIVNCVAGGGRHGR